MHSHMPPDNSSPAPLRRCSTIRALQTMAHLFIIDCIIYQIRMGKKGVLLDNGKNAQSSMALYWKKNREQSKNPKKQYEPTEEEQLDQRAESGFQKWKLHKEKFISKAYEKKEKPVEVQKQVRHDQGQQEQFEKANHKNKGPVHIPGFKSKEILKQRLKPEQIKQISQHDNILKLPNHLSDLTQDDIIRILREKKAKSQLGKHKKQVPQKEDVILGEDFLESFRQNKIEKEVDAPGKLEKMGEVSIQKKQEDFFKSQILNKISKGYQAGTLSMTDSQVVNPQTEAAEANTQSMVITEAARRPLFKPRILNNRK